MDGFIEEECVDCGGLVLGMYENCEECLDWTCSACLYDDGRCFRCTNFFDDDDEYLWGIDAV